MNKKNGIMLAVLIAILIGIGVFFYFQNTQSTKVEENDYEANRTSTANSTNETQENQEQDTHEVKQGITETQNNNPPPVTEEQIATFSTKIYSNDRSSSE